MKDHDEMYQSVLSRYEEYREKRKKRSRFIKRAVPAAACFGLAIAFGVGYYARYAKMPEIPVTPPYTSLPAAEVTETTVSSVSESQAVSVSDSSKNSETDRKTIPTTASGHEGRSEPPVSQEVYPPQMTVTAVSGTAVSSKTAASSKTVHTTVSSRVTNKASSLSTVSQTAGRSTASETTTQPSVSESTAAPTTETAVTTTTAVTLSPARKNVKEYSILFSAERIFDYNSLLNKSYAEFFYNKNDSKEMGFPVNAALEELEQAEARSGGQYPRRRAVILGEIPSYSQRLTYDGFTDILNDPNVIRSGYLYGAVKQVIEKIQPYPDFVYTGESSFTEYWLNSEGTEKIVLVPEMDAVVYAVLGD